MKVLFLDIDGVLNWAGTEDKIDGYTGLCPERIARLNRILEAVPGLKIVISSTWRHCFSSSAYKDFPGLVRLLKKRGLKKDAKVIGATPKKFSYVPRGGEIRMWIDDYKRDQRRARKRSGRESDKVPSREFHRSAPSISHGPLALPPRPSGLLRPSQALRSRRRSRRPKGPLRQDGNRGTLRSLR